MFVAAEDHLPPHVHAYHSGEGWVARFRISFLSDVAGLYRFQRWGRRPAVATLERVAERIVANLPACRESWWTTHGSRSGIGLVNRYIETRSAMGGDGILARVTLKQTAAATRIVSASYSPLGGKIALSMADERVLFLTAGQHIEEAGEW